MNRITPFLVVATLTLGCSMVATSSKEILNKSETLKTTGAYYFLPSGKIHIQVLKGDSDYALKFVETILVPDHSEVFLLDYKNSAVSDDTLTIKLTPDGLLSKVETKAADKTGEIIIKLAEVGKEVAKAAAYVSSVGEKPEVIRDLTFSSSDVNAINAELAKIPGANLQINLDPLASLASTITGESKGICFRPQTPFKLGFVKNNELIEQRILLLPDRAPRVCMPLERAPFVSKVTNLSFEKGILTEVHIEKPSEALAFMEIPLSIAKMLASLPAELLQLKINYSNREKELATAQKAELEAKQALLEYLKKQQEMREERQRSDNPLPLN